MKETLDQKQVNLENCAREPIHIINQIQHHGLYLVFDLENGECLQYSENWKDFSIKLPKDLTLGDFLSSSSIRNFQNSETELPSVLIPDFHEEFLKRAVQLLAHQMDGMVIIECMAKHDDAAHMDHVVANSVNEAINKWSDIDDIQKLSDSTPVLADLKPSGKSLMEDLHNIGGVPGVMKYMLENNLLHGDCLTVTGKTVAENLSNLPSLKDGQSIILTVENPIKPSGHLQILYGNLAEKGSVAKISGNEGEYFEGSAVVFEDEYSVVDGVKNGKIKPGNVVVIRMCGPKGGPGMPEMLKPTSAIMGAGLGDQVALITDGRFSGGSHGFVVGHITPEAIEGGNIALVEDGDIISIDAVNNTIELKVDDKILAERRANWKQPALKVNQGILYKYAKYVASASEGCITDK